jgi:hypothetical protein
MSSSNNSSSTPVLGRGARRSLTQPRSKAVIESDSDSNDLESDDSGDSEYQDSDNGKGKQPVRSKRQVSSEGELLDGEKSGEKENEDEDELMEVSIMIFFIIFF